MADVVNVTKLNLNGVVYKLGKPVYEEIGIGFDRFVELLDRDAYTPMLDVVPSGSTLSYTDADGSVCDFRVGQACVYPSGLSEDGYGIAFLKAVAEGEAVWQDMGAVLERASEAVSTAEEANAYAKAAYTNSNEAVDTANVAKAAVAALEGLANTDEAQQTLAGQVTQIAQNASDIEVLKEKHQVISEAEYAALEVVDQTKIYMLYEDEE